MRQDGQAVKPSERILAVQALPELQEKLREDLRVTGIDMDAAAQVPLLMLFSNVPSHHYACEPWDY